MEDNIEKKLDNQPAEQLQPFRFGMPQLNPFMVE